MAISLSYMHVMQATDI